MLFELLNLEKQNNNDAYKTLIDYVKKYLKDNLNNKIDFYILSEKVGYSYSRLMSIFKQKTGMTMYEYIVDLRISLAKNLLEKSLTPIKDISLKCSFKNFKRFGNMFKEKVGISPSQYRKKSKIGFKDNVFNIKDY